MKILLTALSIGSAPIDSIRPTSYDGIERSVSHFYHSDHNVQIGARIIKDRDTVYSIHLNNGYSTLKYDERPSGRIGAIKRHWFGQNYLQWNASGTIGGEIKHTPCVDDYNRQYYCGDLTAWSEFKDKIFSKSDDYQLGIKFGHIF